MAVQVGRQHTPQGQAAEVAEEQGVLAHPLLVETVQEATQIYKARIMDILPLVGVRPVEMVKALVTQNMVEVTGRKGRRVVEIREEVPCMEGQAAEAAEVAQAVAGVAVLGEPMEMVAVAQ
jgi:hypothetical protein